MSELITPVIRAENIKPKYNKDIKLFNNQNKSLTKNRHVRTETAADVTLFIRILSPVLYFYLYFQIMLLLILAVILILMWCDIDIIKYIYTYN